MKKKLMKVVAIGLATIMTAGMLTGCGGDKSAKSDAPKEGEKIKLSLGMWDPNQKPTMEALAEAYNKENPDVTVEVQLTSYKGGEYWTKLEAGAMGGTAPDVFWMNALHAESYQEGGVLADLTEAAEKSDIKLKENFPASLINMYTINDKLYAISKDFGVRALWYNKELFDKAGVAYPTDDWTFDDMKEAIKQLNGKMGEGVYPIAAPVDFESEYYPTVHAAGGYVLNKDKTKSGYEDPKTMEGVQCWIDFIEEGYSPSLADLTDTNADTRFESGQLAMNFAGSYMTPQFLGNEAISNKIDLVEFPEYNGKEPNLIGGLGYAVYEKSKNKDAAIDFAIWMGSEEAMKIQGEKGAVISSRNDAQKYFAESRPDWNLKAYTNHVADATPMPFCKSSAEIYDLEAKKYTEAYAGTKTLEEVSKELQTEVDAILDKMNSK